MNSKSIKVRTVDLTKKFKLNRKETITAVEKMNLEATSGEVLGILGPNGAGKTTALRMISTILQPTSGTAVVEGQDVRENPLKVRQSIGYLATEMGLYGRLTPRETLTFFARINGLEEGLIKSRIEEVFRILDMEEFQGRKVNNLSTGMKQKLSLARSIIHDPSILIFDEPTQGLDLMTSKTVTDYIQDFTRENKTIILSTHIMHVAEKLCDKVAILFDGEVKAFGGMEQLLKRHDEESLESLFFKVAEDGNN
ncbi:ATP-binding cassette domain-containing protein [Candidatus Bipolaricaulota bacterium]|nr:ATP-binding cassette domain-containing protein [Candidatus Bipolaricaulota bacterium]